LGQLADASPAQWVKTLVSKMKSVEERTNEKYNVSEALLRQSERLIPKARFFDSVWIPNASLI
jgi:hypothetical protein